MRTGYVQIPSFTGQRSQSIAYRGGIRWIEPVVLPYGYRYMMRKSDGNFFQIGKGVYVFEKPVEQIEFQVERPSLYPTGSCPATGIGFVWGEGDVPPRRPEPIRSTVCLSASLAHEDDFALFSTSSFQQLVNRCFRVLEVVKTKIDLAFYYSRTAPPDLQYNCAPAVATIVKDGETDTVLCWETNLAVSGTTIFGTITGGVEIAGHPFSLVVLHDDSIAGASNLAVDVYVDFLTIPL